MLGNNVRAVWCSSLFALLIAVVPTAAAEDPGLANLATCRESWLDWQKNKDPKLLPFAKYLNAHFSQKENEPGLFPKDAVSLDGFRVLQVYPESVGMGVGFSVLVAATFDNAKKTFERGAGGALSHCETSDGMRSCDRQIADKRTFMLMSSDKPGDTQTLVGCYYFYEK